MRIFYKLSALCLAIALAAGTAHARCGDPYSCNKKGAKRAIERGAEAVRDGAKHALNEGKKVVDQAREDIGNGLDRIDPRITQMGRDIDHWRRDFWASVHSGPALAIWLQKSRDSAYSSAAPIYPEMRAALKGWFSDELLDKVRFKIGDGGALNFANLTLRYNDAVEAITLIDVIVFRSRSEASNPALWAHEMRHVQQFAEWGVRKFAVRYMRSWNTVENEAYELQNRFEAEWDKTAAHVVAPAQPATTPPVLPVSVQPPAPPKPRPLPRKLPWAAY